MKYLSLIKILGIGFLGGSIPLAAFIMYNSSNTLLSDQVIDGNRTTGAQFVGLTANGTGNLDFTSASESTINSVVHVTTKVVRTTFQRDPFQEFFYGPGAGGKEYKQFGASAGSGVIISSEGYIVTNNHVIEEASEIEVVEQRQATPKPVLPEKYQGKSIEDVAKMHQEAEKRLSVQGQEIGEVRKLADELIRQNLESKQSAKKIEPEVDFFEDPQAAIQKAVDNNPDVQSSKLAFANGPIFSFLIP